MLGIAIINYNKYEKTIDCINSIFSTVKSEYKIYLLDNASQNESFDQLKKTYLGNQKVELIKSDENLGYAKGNNLCIEKAKADGCDYILISNNDILFGKNSIEILLDKIKSGDYLIVAPQIKNINNTLQNSIKITKPDFKEYMMYSTYLHNFVPKNKKIEHYKSAFPKEFCNVYWVSGACFIADMKKFEQIGFFDPYTFLYFEEYILSEKAVNHNMKIAFEPSAQVIHYHGASTGGNANLFTRIANLESELYFFSKYNNASKSQLKKLQTIRCLEVLFTFTKEKKIKDALSFVNQSKSILKKNKENIDEN